jgi:hypothetical protein
MRLIADTHLHLYPGYDTQKALRHLVDNLGELSGDAIKIGFLAERRDCNFFAQIATGADLGGFKVQPTSEPDAVSICLDGKPVFYLIAGRQVVTAERIELLSLASRLNIAEGLPADETVRSILNAKGIPVLSWAPGKWFFERGSVVRRLITRFKSVEILFGDTSLRPTLWATPWLMHEAGRRGFKILAGSDPLPFAGDEKYMGTYATIMEGEFDAAKPATSVRNLMLSPGFSPLLTGLRCGPIETARRLLKNRASSAFQKKC